MLPRHIKSLEVLKYVPHIPIGTETRDSCGGHTSASTMNKGSPETEASMFEVFTTANERNCIIQANWTQRLVTENLALFCKNSNKPFFFLTIISWGRGFNMSGYMCEAASFARMWEFVLRPRHSRC